MVCSFTAVDTCNRDWGFAFDCRCGDAGHCKKSVGRPIRTGYFFRCIFGCGYCNYSGNWFRFGRKFCRDIGIYRCVCRFFGSTYPCKYWFKSKYSKIVAVRYGVKCRMQCNCKFYCIYDKRQGKRSDSQSLVAGEFKRCRLDNKSGCLICSAGRFCIFSDTISYLKFNAVWR